MCANELILIFENENVANYYNNDKGCECFCTYLSHFEERRYPSENFPSNIVSRSPTISNLQVNILKRMKTLIDTKTSVETQPVMFTYHALGNGFMLVK